MHLSGRANAILLEREIGIRPSVSAMYEGNIPENVIMKYAGHKDVNTTRHYNRSRLFTTDSDDEVRNLMKIENRTKK